MDRMEDISEEGSSLDTSQSSCKALSKDKGIKEKSKVLRPTQLKHFLEPPKSFSASNRPGRSRQRAHTKSQLDKDMTEGQTKNNILLDESNKSYIDTRVVQVENGKAIPQIFVNDDISIAFVERNVNGNKNVENDNCNSSSTEGSGIENEKNSSNLKMKPKTKIKGKTINKSDCKSKVNKNNNNSPSNLLIQVTLHRPLEWQVSASSSSASIPTSAPSKMSSSRSRSRTKAISLAISPMSRTSTAASTQNNANLNKNLDNKNWQEPLSLTKELFIDCNGNPNLLNAKDNPIMQNNIGVARESSQTRKNHQMSSKMRANMITNEDSSSSDDCGVQRTCRYNFQLGQESEKQTRHHRRKRGQQQQQAVSKSNIDRQITKQHTLPSQFCATNGCKNFNRRTRSEDCKGILRRGESGEKLVINLGFPHGKNDSAATFQPVMTWFVESDLNVKDKNKSMGANGSAHDGRLKCRSQSSSALYCIGKSGNGVNGQLNYNPVIPVNGSTQILSTSIPAELWDLPATTKSYSPITQKHAGTINTSIQQSSNNYVNPACTANHHYKQNVNIKSRVSDPASGKSVKKDGKSCMSNKKSAGNGNSRAKLYAISCPDVANTPSQADCHFLVDYSPYSRERLVGGPSVPLPTPIVAATSKPELATPQQQQQLLHHHLCGPQNHHQHGGAEQLGYRVPLMTTQMQVAPPHPCCHINHHQLHQQLPHYRSDNFIHASSYMPMQHQHPTAVVQQIPSTFYQQQQQHQGNRQQQRPPDQIDMKSSYISLPPFVTEENTFDVRLIRDVRGLGLSVTGGLDCQEKYAGLVRIKKVFPLGPAFQSGLLRSWDIILKANGVPLTGLTNHEALEVLRTTPTETILTICRPPPGIPGFQDSDHQQQQLHHHHQLVQAQSLSQIPIATSQNQQQQSYPISYYAQQQFQHYASSGQLNHLQQQQLQQHHSQQQMKGTVQNSYDNEAFSMSSKSKSLSSLKIPNATANSQEIYGEFEVTLEKIGGSLGFTLRQEDTSVLGHYVRALVKDPALTDGRVQPGDRILLVNGQNLAGMSHSEAISFLRNCPTQVTLKLYRDMAPTPLSPLSPTESIKAKPLRKEAIDMLNDLALRKQRSGSESDQKDQKYSLPGSGAGRTSALRGNIKLSQLDANGPATLPRRRVHAGVTPSPEVLSAALDRFAGRPKSPKLSQKSHSSEMSCTNVRGSGDSGSCGSSMNMSSHPNNNNNTLLRSNNNYARSSGSGESTPGTIQSRSKKTDNSKIKRTSSGEQQQKSKVSTIGKKSISSSSTTSTTTGIDIEQVNRTTTGSNGSISIDGTISSRCSSGTGIGKELESSGVEMGSTENNAESSPERKPSFRHLTQHLDRISSLEDDNSYTSLNHADSIVSEPGFTSVNNSPSQSTRKSNFRHGQPQYQSEMLPTTTSNANKKGRGAKGKKLLFSSTTTKDLDSGQLILGLSTGDSTPTALSDIDIPSTLSSSSGIGGTSQSHQTNKPEKASASSAAASTCSGSSTSVACSNSGVSNKAGASGGLLKWKGVLFSQDDGGGVDEYDEEDDGDLLEDDEGNEDVDSSFRHLVGGSGGSSLVGRKSQNDADRISFHHLTPGDKGLLPQRRSPDGREFQESTTESSIRTAADGEQIFTVQLSRGWCSRLGFSLQGCDGNTFISAIYPDSVAAKDGRLHVGDEVLTINGIVIRDMNTAEVIDMMRKTRGVMNITVVRKSFKESELNPEENQLGLT